MSENVKRWHMGDHILVRECLRNEIWSVKPVTVVGDSSSLIAYYMAEGTAWKQPKARTGGRPSPRDLLPGSQFQLVDDTWTGDSCLYLVEPGANVATLLFFVPPEQSLRCWYINLQAPLRRTALGFDYLDEILDLVVEPDKSAWRWKDEDELAEAVRLRIFTQARADDLHKAGQATLQNLMDGRPPFDRDWAAWRAPSGWAIPQLGPKWNESASLSGS